MSNDISYKEEQRFQDGVTLGIMGGGVLGAFFGLTKVVLTGGPMLHAALYLAIAVVLLVGIWYLNRARLKVSLNEKRIKFKMSPQHKKSKKIKWSEVKSMEIIRTPKFASWLGSNVMYGTHMFSFTGKNGISLETNNGERYFIGIKNTERAAELLDMA